MLKWLKTLFKPSSPSSSSTSTSEGSVDKVVDGRRLSETERRNDLESKPAPLDPLRPEFKSPKDGILWRSYDDTITILNEKTRPVLAFVMDYDGTRWPFLREILRAMPKNEKLRNLLDGPCVAMLLKADSMPEYMAALGAGRDYHIAILSPAGLTPLEIFNYVTGKPETLVEKIASDLEAIASLWA
jgi:hypothetical protein